jgi:hypothetical protein
MDPITIAKTAMAVKGVTDKIYDGIGAHYGNKNQHVKGETLKGLGKWGIIGAAAGYARGKKREREFEATDKDITTARINNIMSIRDQAAQGLDQLASTPIMQPITPPTPSLNSGGDINSKIKSILTMKPVPMFRSGGELLLENVIVDGPSHDETNDTGLKDDKGIPVVKDGVKVAEIESKELVLNEGASQELVNLYKEYQKNPSQTLLNKIAALMDYELKYNTYDYTKELLA